MRVFVTIETVYVVDVTTDDPEKAELAVENNWDTIYRHECQQVGDGRFLAVRAENASDKR